MTKLTSKDFAAKWGKIQLKEITTAQSHFLDVCALIDHPAPLDADPKGEFFTFEAVTEKTGGKIHTEPDRANAGFTLWAIRLFWNVC